MQINKLLTVKGNRGIREIHRELGRIMWDDVGMARTEESLTRALQASPTAHLDTTVDHPMFGPLNWREALLFTRLHDLDHAGQLGKNAEALK